MTYEQRRAKWNPEYAAYHDKVVEACVEMFSGRSKNDDGSPTTDADIRKFFGEVCDYEEEFYDDIPPEETAEHQWEACT